MQSCMACRNALSIHSTIKLSGRPHVTIRWKAPVRDCLYRRLNRLLLQRQSNWVQFQEFAGILSSGCPCYLEDFIDPRILARSELLWIPQPRTYSTEAFRGSFSHYRRNRCTDRQTSAGARPARGCGSRRRPTSRPPEGHNCCSKNQRLSQAFQAGSFA